MALYACLFITAIFIALIVYNAVNSKDIFIKILYINICATLTSLFICFYGTIKVNNSYIDIALIYFLLNTITTIAYLKYFLYKKEKVKIQNNDSAE